MNRQWAFAWVVLVLSVSPSAPAAAQEGDGFRTLHTDLNYQIRVHRALGFVDGIAQTRDGYLWFATSMGLARYDGLDLAVRICNSMRWRSGPKTPVCSDR